MNNFLLLLSEKLKSNKIRVLCGFILIFSYLIFANLLPILLFSIICTFGAGFGFWLAIAYIIGTTLSVIVNFLVNPKHRALAFDEEKAIEKYVREAKGNKLSKSEVRKKLNDVGWKDQLITNIIDSVYRQEDNVGAKKDKASEIFS